MNPIETLKKVKNQLKNFSSADAVSGLPVTSDWAQHGELYRGKVRDLLIGDDFIYMYHTDRLSAFDRQIALVPGKGILLSLISQFWHQTLRNIIPCARLEVLDDRMLKMEKTQVIKVEVVVRGYLAGRMLREYEKGVRDFCGQKLPDGLEPFAQLPCPILTPTTKADVGQHDMDLSAQDAIEAGLCTKREWDEISSYALKAFAKGQEVYGEKGWILVDTKYEFGRSIQELKESQIKIIDEIHTPDSSRLWVKDSYRSRLQKKQAPEMLDKEIVRRYLLDQGFSGEGEVPEVPQMELQKLLGVYVRVAEALLL